MIRGALSTAGLRNMLDGYRTKPITSESNPFGYSESYVVPVSSTLENPLASVNLTYPLAEDRFRLNSWNLLISYRRSIS